MAETIQRQLPVIVSTMLLLLAIFGGFWSLADPRAELKNIRESYLTIREHNEFVSRFEKDVLRLEDNDKSTFGRYSAFAESFANKAETKEALRALELRVSQLSERLSILQQEQRNVGGNTGRSR